MLYRNHSALNLQLCIHTCTCIYIQLCIHTCIHVYTYNSSSNEHTMQCRIFLTCQCLLLSEVPPHPRSRPGAWGAAAGAGPGGRARRGSPGTAGEHRLRGTAGVAADVVAVVVVVVVVVVVEGSRSVAALGGPPGDFASHPPPPDRPDPRSSRAHIWMRTSWNETVVTRPMW